MSSERKKLADELQKPKSKHPYWKVVDHHTTKERQRRRYWEVPCRNGMESKDKLRQFQYRQMDMKWMVIAEYHDKQAAMQCVLQRSS